MAAPGVLWTAARQDPAARGEVNNRGYHQEVMHIQRSSNFRNRVANIGNDLLLIGTSNELYYIQYQELAKSMGWWGEGADRSGRSDPRSAAVAVVKTGQPALVNAGDAAACGQEGNGNALEFAFDETQDWRRSQLRRRQVLRRARRRG